MSKDFVITRYANLGDRLGLLVALVTDLHNCEHQELLFSLEYEKPDIILCAGDILERHMENASKWTESEINTIIASIGKQNTSERIMWLLDRLTEQAGKATYKDEDTAIEFLKQLPSIAQTFYSVGNHEWYFLPSDYQMFTEKDITLLDNADCVAEVSEQQVRIGGLSTRYDLEWLRRYSQKDGYKILMCHHPEYYRKTIQNTDYDTFNLIVSGHYHGGQWRIKDKSVYVPRTGLFMKDAVGQYGKHIISAGVANTTRFPRYGNPCELVMIEI